MSDVEREILEGTFVGKRYVSMDRSAPLGKTAAEIRLWAVPTVRERKGMSSLTAYQVTEI